jgi:hypothetical protein
MVLSLVYGWEKRNKNYKGSTINTWVIPLVSQEYNSSSRNNNNHWTLDSVLPYIFLAFRKYQATSELYRAEMPVICRKIFHLWSIF